MVHYQKRSPTRFDEFKDILNNLAVGLKADLGITMDDKLAARNSEGQSTAPELMEKCELVLENVASLETKIAEGVSVAYLIQEDVQITHTAVKKQAKAR